MAVHMAEIEYVIPESWRIAHQMPAQEKVPVVGATLRLFWPATGSFRGLPMLFVLEDDTVLPGSFQRRDARATSSYLV